MVVWHNGKVSGPRFEDGSYDIDGGYSLIIKNVSAEDTGRMYCIVSNYNGILIENYTDIAVTDTPVTTIQNAILQMREATFGILQCIVHIKAERVSWKRVTSSANDSLVVIANNKDDAEVNETNYDLDTYNMTQENSLVIRDVQVHHGGLYVCEATDFDTGISFRNETFLSVVVYEMSYGELFRIANALEQTTEYESDRVKACSGSDFQRNKVTPASGNDQGEEIVSANQGTPLTSSHLEDREETQTEKIGMTGTLSGTSNKEPIMNNSIDSLSEELIKLQRILKLTVEDMVDIESSSRPATLSLLKIWKEKPREVVFNYRAALAYELRQHKMSRLADQVLAVYEMSYGELFRIANALEQTTEYESDRVKACSGSDFQRNKVTPASGNDQGEEIVSANQGTPLTSSHLEDREETQTEKIGMTGTLSGTSNKEPIMNNSIDSLSEELIKLQRILKLTVEDMVDIESSSRPATLSLLKIWKEKPREVVFNYRAALAYELRQHKMSRLADQVLAGEYIKEETSHEFILNIVQRLTRDQLMIIGNLLKLSKGNWHTETPLDDITKQICDWVADWTKKMKGNSKTFFKGVKKLKDDVIELTGLTSVSVAHRDLNDKLVDNGFLALAREVMIIEQQLAWM
nr:uncharacterized protein LOC129271933 [Lytechinus pictus]